MEFRRKDVEGEPPIYFMGHSQDLLRVLTQTWGCRVTFGEDQSYVHVPHCPTCAETKPMGRDIDRTQEYSTSFDIQIYYDEDVPILCYRRKHVKGRMAYCSDGHKWVHKVVILDL